MLFESGVTLTHLIRLILGRRFRASVIVLHVLDLRSRNPQFSFTLAALFWSASTASLHSLRCEPDGIALQRVLTVLTIQCEAPASEQLILREALILPDFVSLSRPTAIGCKLASWRDVHDCLLDRDEKKPVHELTNSASPRSTVGSRRPGTSVDEKNRHCEEPFRVLTAVFSHERNVLTELRTLLAKRVALSQLQCGPPTGTMSISIESHERARTSKAIASNLADCPERATAWWSARLCVAGTRKSASDIWIRSDEDWGRCLNTTVETFVDDATSHSILLSVAAQKSRLGLTAGHLRHLSASSVNSSEKKKEDSTLLTIDTSCSSFFYLCIFQWCDFLAHLHFPVEFVRSSTLHELHDAVHSAIDSAGFHFTPFLKDDLVSHVHHPIDYRARTPTRRELFQCEIFFSQCVRPDQGHPRQRLYPWLTSLLRCHLLCTDDPGSSTRLRVGRCRWFER